MTMKSFPVKFWLGVFAVGFAVQAQAATIRQGDPFYTVGKVKLSSKRVAKAVVDKALLESIEKQFRSEALVSKAPNLEQFVPGGPGVPGAGGGAAGGNPGLAIADIALRVWSIIQDNKAVLNVSRQNVKALPVLAKTDWTALTGWQPEHGLEFTMTVENLYGIDVISVSYVVSVIYGGSVKGVGKYIASARVIPRKIEVLWGFNMDVNVAEVAVQNIGSEKNPHAAITLDVGVTYGSILMQESFTNSYRVQGNGVIADLTSGKSYFTR
jgi:hypothetical protein